MKLPAKKKGISEQLLKLIAYNPIAGLSPHKHKKRAEGGSVRKVPKTFDTKLSPLDEFAYRQWVKDNNVPTNPDATAPQDYDMRGFWQGLQQQNPKAQSAVDPNDNRLHYPDNWKTPIHQTFSNESQWAQPGAPSWTEDDKLVAPNGWVVFDDRKAPSDAERLLTVPTRAVGGAVRLLDHIREEAAKVHRSPSQPQKEAGNYRKGHINWNGLDISIENPSGSFREKRDEKGSLIWRARLPAHYGYIRGSKGMDGDHVDVFIGPHVKSPIVYVIDQLDHKTGEYDEHKCMLGFGSEKQAKEAYARAFSDGKGKDRIGHVTEMTVNQFKDWVKNGNTEEPLKRAAGGRIHMADGGAPNSDLLSQLNAPEPAADPKILDQLNAPDVGGLSAAYSGAKQGATFGFSDELAGANAAGPEWAGHLPHGLGLVARPAIGAARLAKQYFMGNDPEATAQYEQARDEERRQDELAKQQHPYLHMAGEVAGSIPAMAVLPGGEVAQGAGLGMRMLKGAQVGAEYGGLSGLGSGKDTGERALNAATGIVSGIVGGAAAPVIGAAASHVADKVISPAVGAIRGAINPEAEASRRLAAALQKDQELIAAGKAEGMSPTDWVKARAAGEPVTLADLGSANTQALLRSSANTSPEGRAILEKALNDRFYGQTERVANEVRGLVAGGANAGKTAEDLVAAYDKGRVPAYKQAYREGDKEIVSPAIERLMGSPTFEQAMKNAVSTGKDRAIAEGYGAFNPGVSVENGMIKFTKTNPKGVPQYPNLQYWDAVKKELDSMASVARRQGDTSSVAGSLATTLRNELDAQVPSYANARGIAAQYFGESNALEAGQKLAGKKVDPEQIAGIMKKMKPDERDLFREGYASDWANRVISNISDTRDITKAMFNSPNERARALAVFGPAGLTKMEARMSLETIMDGARKAMGNSTTARQLIEAGLAGGTLEGYLSGWDPQKMAAGAAGAAGARKFIGSEMAAGARKLVGKVDSKTARLVAELLTSDDPNKLSLGLRMAQKNQRISDGLKNIANRLSLAGQQQTAPSVVNPTLRAIQGAVPAGASDEQQGPPWVVNQ